jgi:signal transduction histidine kinase
LQRARDAAVETARLKGEFAANVTHELRTPMNGVLGLLDLLSDGKLNARQAEYVDLARKSAEGLLGLVDNILDFSKNDSGIARQETGEIILRDLIEDIVELVGTQALGKGVDIGYFMAMDVPGTLSIDASKVKQVLINLLGNAVKFTELGEVFLPSPDRPALSLLCALQCPIPVSASMLRCSSGFSNPLPRAMRPPASVIRARGSA